MFFRCDFGVSPDFSDFSAPFLPIFGQTFFFRKNIDVFCNINARFLKYLNFVVCFARNNMRKITSYLSLPVISGSQHKILGTITGVLCEKRLKSVGFFAFSDLYSKDSENMYVAARSLKKINDDSVVLSNLLCIKPIRRFGKRPYRISPRRARIYRRRKSTRGSFGFVLR